MFLYGDSVQQIQCVCAVVNEVNTLSLDCHQAKESSGAGRIARVVDRLYGDLHSAWSGLDNVSVVSVRGQDMAAGGEGQTERVVQVPIRRNSNAVTGR